MRERRSVSEGNKDHGAGHCAGLDRAEIREKISKRIL